MSVDEAGPGPGNALLLEHGMIGFERFTGFTLAPIAEAPPFCLLRAVDAPDVSFIVVAASDAAPDYAPALPAWLGAQLEAQGVQQVELMLVVTLASDGAATVNLRAPLVLWQCRQRGAQAVLDQALSLRQPLRAGAG